VVRLSVVGVYAEDNPFLAARADPAHPRVRIELAMNDFYLRQGRVGQANQNAAFGALAQAPLAAEPFLLAGVAALVQGDNARGDRLLAEARRRNPRLRMARLLLLDRSLVEGRTADAVAEMASLGRLIDGTDQLFTPMLAKMTLDSRTSAALVPMLRREPRLQEAVLEQLATMGADPNLIVRIASDGGTVQGRERPWQRIVLSTLVSAGDLKRALDLWRRFAAVTERGATKGIYDGRFAGLPGPPPFNWDLAGGPVGVVDRVRNVGLQVDYYGRQDGDLASQLLMLAPGRYRLQFNAEGNAKGQTSRLIWSLSCQRVNISLLQLPITGVTASNRRFVGSFTIPPDCPAQWLKLRGGSGDVADEQSVTLSALSIQPEASS
jgi:hypothetical protein